MRAAHTLQSVHSAVRTHSNAVLSLAAQYSTLCVCNRSPCNPCRSHAPGCAPCCSVQLWRAPARPSLPTASQQLSSAAAVLNQCCEKEDNAAASSVLLRHRYYYCRPRYQERITSSCHHYSSNYVKYYYALDHYPRPMGPHHKHNYIIDRPNTILSPRKQTPLDALWKLIHVPSTMAPRKPQWKRLRKWLLTWLHITAAETASGTAAEKAQEHCG